MSVAAVRLFQPGESGPQTLTVGALVALYLRHCTVEHVHGAKAAAHRTRVLKDFCASYGTLPVCDLKPFMLSDWIEAHPLWKSVSTRRGACNAVRACFQWAAAQERIDRQPFKSVRYGEAERRPEMTDDTLTQLERAAPKNFEAALRFLRLTGCRIGELAAAQWGDVDLDRGTWVINRHKSRKRTGKPKVVALVGEAVALLRSLAGSAEPSAGTTFAGALTVSAGTVNGTAVSAKAEPVATGYIFLNAYGRPWTSQTIGQYLRRLLKRKGIQTPARLHGLRHAFATAAIAAGAPVSLIAHQLGHSSPEITSRLYVHIGLAHMDQIKAAIQLGIPKKSESPTQQFPPQSGP